MSLLRSSLASALILAAYLTACSDKSSTGPGARDKSPGAPSLTVSTSTKTVLGQATFGDPKDHHDGIKVERKTGDWRFDVKSNSAFDVAVQSIAFAPGTSSGWHSHPGPVFIQVVLGTITFYMGDDRRCRPIVRTAGQGYVDVGDHTHIARNETTLPAQTVVTYFAPPGTLPAALRIDQPQPGNCPASIH